MKINQKKIALFGLSSSLLFSNLGFVNNSYAVMANQELKLEKRLALNNDYYIKSDNTIIFNVVNDGKEIYKTEIPIIRSKTMKIGEIGRGKVYAEKKSENIKTTRDFFLDLQDLFVKEYKNRVYPEQIKIRSKIIPLPKIKNNKIEIIKKKKTNNKYETITTRELNLKKITKKYKKTMVNGFKVKFKKRNRKNLSLEDYLSNFDFLLTNKNKSVRFHDPKYANEIFYNYSRHLKSCSEKYNVPLPILKGVLMYEHGNVTSPTGMKGPGQMSMSSIETSLNFIKSNGIQEGDLFKFTKLKSKNRIKNREVLEYLLNSKKHNIEAATAYLSFLHNSFSDWSLAIAAYQIGIGVMADILEFNKGIKTKEWKKKFIKRVSQSGKGRFQYKGIDNSNLRNIRNYVKSNDITMVDILTNSATMNYYKRKLKPYRKNAGSEYYRLENYSLRVLNLSNKYLRN